MKLQSAKNKFIRMREVLERTGYSKAWIYRLMSTGEFPSSVKIGSRSIAFIESEVEDWIYKKINNNGNNTGESNCIEINNEVWIDLEVKPPLLLSEVLVYCPNHNEYVVAKYLGIGKFLWHRDKYGKGYYCKPSHWMILPPKPTK